MKFEIEVLKEKIRELRLKKRTNMTADYAWALEDIDNLIKEIEAESCEHVFEPIPESYDVRRCSWKARCTKCGFEPE